MEEKQKIAITEDIISKSILILKNVISGNTSQPARISLNESKAHFEEIEASLNLNLEPIVHKKQVPRKKVSGEIVHNEIELQSAVIKYLDEVKTNPNTQHQIKGILLQREDKGFSSKGETINLDSFAREFSLHMECQACHKQGHVACTHCKGQKQQPCQTCKGRKQSPCHTCRGQRTIKNTQGKIENCRDCQGKGLMPCRQCRAIGFVPCQPCKQTGKIQCDRCHGSGYFTMLEHVTLKLKTSFKLKPSNLPFDLSEYIKENRKKALLKNEIQVSELEKKDDDSFSIHYIIKVPYGPISFTLNESQTIGGELFGYNGSLINFDNFLEDNLCKKPIKTYINFANGKGSLLNFNKSVRKTNLLKQLLINVAANSKKEAFAKLKSLYPVGIRTQLLKNLVIKTDKAIKRITIKNRFIGLGVGLLIVSLLYSIYYLGPVREFIEPYIPKDEIKIFIDVLIIFIGGSITSLSIHLFSKNALKRFLKTFLNPGQDIKIIPHTGKSAYFGYLAGLIIYCSIIFLMPYVSKIPPEWVLDLLIKLPI